MKHFLLVALILLSTLFSSLLHSEDITAAPSKPNILIILADDMGYSDLGCFGSEIQTPNLDKLAMNGVRFSNFYNMSRCCPSRASILTGLYSHQAGVGNMTKDLGLPAYQGYLNNNCVTIAEALKSAGYFTAMCGKWHVGGEDFKVTPPKRGFDRSLAAVHGGFYWQSKSKDGKEGTWWLDGKNIPNDSPELPKDWYSTDVIADYGIKYIKEAVSQKKPFFMYMAHTAPHFPLSAPTAEVEKYKGKYMAGWDRLREERYKKQLALGIVDPSWALSALPKGQPKLEDVKPWDSLTAQEKERSDEIMAIYAACTDRMDQAIGRVVAELESQNILDNTLIMFLSDNGAEKGGGTYGKLADKKESEGRSAVAMQGQAWATLSNTPFRYYKCMEHEGGISTSFIAHWPKGITKKGSISREPAHLIDLMPTCVEVAGAKYPEEFNGNKITPMEGKSIVPVFSGGSVGHDLLYFEHSGNRAIRMGDWKMVEERGGPMELYNITSDRSELNNLASKHPEILKDLTAKWEAWAKRTGASPTPKEEGTKAEKKAAKKGHSEESGSE